jgi:hypothetical protein
LFTVPGLGRFRRHWTESLPLITFSNYLAVRTTGKPSQVGNGWLAPADSPNVLFAQI